MVPAEVLNSTDWYLTLPIGGGRRPGQAVVRQAITALPSAKPEIVGARSTGGLRRRP
jgi:hypothetical protein